MGTRLKKGQRFNPYRLFNGMFLPNLIARTRLLSPTDKLVWARLCQFAGENGICFPSFRRIAYEVGISRSGAIKSVNSLVDKGFLEKHVPDNVSLGNQKTNQYFFLWHPVLNEAFEAPSTQSVPGVSSLDAPSSQSEPALVEKVDQPSSQSEPKEIHKENHKKTTTTTNYSSEASPPEAEKSGGGGFSLSDFESRYIELKVKRTVAEGEIKKSPNRLKISLTRLAAAGELDISDLDDLERWDKASSALKGNSFSGGENGPLDKARLHEELSVIMTESKAWWEELSSDHPAKTEIKPSYIQDEMWIRQQYKKYGVENDQ